MLQIQRLCFLQYLYEILVFTGHKEEAGTESQVQMIVSGNRDETDVRILKSESSQAVEGNHLCISRSFKISDGEVGVFVPKWLV